MAGIHSISSSTDKTLQRWKSLPKTKEKGRRRLVMQDQRSLSDIFEILNIASMTATWRLDNGRIVPCRKMMNKWTAGPIWAGVRAAQKPKMDLAHVLYMQGVHGA
jgi:hypothetical protein